MKYLFVLVLVSLVACTTTSQVLPTGKDSYVVTAKGGSGPFNQDETEAAIIAANQFCKNKNEVATIAHTDTRGVPGWTQIRSSVQFICSDEANQKPSILRPDHGIITIENH